MTHNNNGGNKLGVRKLTTMIIFLILTSIIFFNNTLSTVENENREKSLISDSSRSSELNPLLNENYFWSTSKVISEPLFSGNININESYEPKIAVEGDNVYVVWEDGTDLYGSGSDYDIFYRYFNGTTWSQIQVISEPILGANSNIGTSYTPDITVLNGNIYVVWSDRNDTNGAGGDTDIFYRCNLSGSGWEDIQVISEPVFGADVNNLTSEAPRLAVETGKIYVTWSDSSNISNAGYDLDIFYRCNLTGSNWEPIQVISEPEYSKNSNTGVSNLPVIAVDNGKIYIVWVDSNNTYNAGPDWDIFYKCNLSGVDWEPVQVISEPVKNFDINQVYSMSPSIDVENGKIYVAWGDANNTNNAGVDLDIFFKCNLTGTHWEDEQVISEPVVGYNYNTQTSHAPSISVENSKIYLVWDDQNNTNNAGNDDDIFFRCNLSGSGWEPVQVISEPEKGNNFNLGWSYFSDIEVHENKSHLVWRDSNNTAGTGNDIDIFYSRTVTPPTLSIPNVKPTSGNTSTEFNFTVIYTNSDNIQPQNILVKLDGIKYPLLETDADDIYYHDGKKYYFNVTNLDIGTHTHKFWVYDGTFTNSTSQTNEPIVYNTPPEILTVDNLTAVEEIQYYETYEYLDIDEVNIGQVVNWEFKSNADWLKFDLSTGVLRGKPSNDDVGEWWVNISINDTMDTDFTNYTLTVIDVNDNPIINTTNVVTTNEDELYEVDYDATDIDSVIEDQSWSLVTNGNTWLNLDQNTGILTGIPTNDEVGSYWVNITVFDGEGGFDFTNFTLYVINVNDPPQIITEDVLTAKVGELYEVDYNATDIDSQISHQMWILDTNATWLSINPFTGFLQGKSLSRYSESYYVNVSVYDGDGGQDWHEFTLTLVRNNTPPSIISTDLTTATVDNYYYMDYEAVDDNTPDNELIWALETNATWLSIDPNTGFLSGIPGESDIGIFWVKITVFDTENGFSVRYFNLTVENPIIYHPPELKNGKIVPSSGNIATQFTFSVNYFDDDCDVPMYIQVVIDDSTHNMQLKSGENATDGVYEYVTKLSEGRHVYYFTASDGWYTINTENYTTPYISVISDEHVQDRQIWVWAIFIVVLIVIITIIITIFISRSKKKEERKKEMEHPSPVPRYQQPPPPPVQQPIPPVERPPRQVMAPPPEPPSEKQVQPKIKLVGMQDLDEDIEE
jgi:hypothetical protein